MPKFSIIIPVYNAEKYIRKCLDSIKNQTFKDYEVIIVNDGSTDNSLNILKEYNYKVINQKNSGPSIARNKAIKEAKGEYILFVDSDDYIDKDMLEKINSKTKNNPDVIRYQMREVLEKENKINNYNEKPFDNLSGEEAFKEIIKYHYVDLVCCYAIKREYFEKEKYEFKPNKYHEDFGLMLLVIIKASLVNSIDYIGYNYVQHEGSIMNNNDYEKTKKKVNDFYDHYKFILKEMNKTNLDQKYIRSFMANSFVLKICELKNKEYKEYKKILKEENVYDNILSDTKVRKIKKIIMKISPKFYSRLIKL